jgi:hypothetical protein
MYTDVHHTLYIVYGSVQYICVYVYTNTRLHHKTMCAYTELVQRIQCTPLWSNKIQVCYIHTFCLWLLLVKSYMHVQERYIQPYIAICTCNVYVHSTLVQLRVPALLIENRWTFPLHIGVVYCAAYLHHTDVMLDCYSMTYTVQHFTYMYGTV